MFEKNLVQRILTHLREDTDTWWYKIPDPSKCPKCGSIGIASKRPFDIIGAVRGRSIAIEVKTKNFNLKKLPPHQAAQLILHFIGGGLSFVIIDSMAYKISHDNGHIKYEQPEPYLSAILTYQTVYGK